MLQNALGTTIIFQKAVAFYPEISIFVSLEISEALGFSRDL
jgi:hypothetical protein